MIEYFIKGSNIMKSLFLMGIGVMGVFSVLILFFVLIKVLVKLFPEKSE